MSYEVEMQEKNDPGIVSCSLCDRSISKDLYQSVTVNFGFIALHVKKG